jgi:hypothetical protein
VKSLDKIEIDKAVNKEVSRLKKIYKDIPLNDKALVDGLIIQAARLRISLDVMWEDISVNGDTEQFSQSEKTEPYERERPVARLFNARDKNYQTIIKLLNDKLPEAALSDPAEELLKFAVGGKK